MAKLASSDDHVDPLIPLLRIAHLTRRRVRPVVIHAFVRLPLLIQLLELMLAFCTRGRDAHVIHHRQRQLGEAEIATPVRGLRNLRRIQVVAIFLLG